MNKFTTLFTTTLIACSLVQVVSAQDSEGFNGHRAGIGYSNTDISFFDRSFDWGDGVKLEYGYDFNHIAGINVSYQRNNDSAAGVKLDASAFKVDSDIGYTFELEGFNVKPYGAIGLVRSNTDMTGYEKVNVKDTSILIGLGVRMSLDMGIYADLRFDAYNIEDVDTDQFSFTVGYMF